MFSFLTFLFKVISSLVKSKKDLIVRIQLHMSEKQIMRILHKDIDYYNSKRPHQGIAQRIPKGYKSMIHGEVIKFPVLGGLCNHYIRKVA